MHWLTKQKFILLSNSYASVFLNIGPNFEPVVLLLHGCWITVLLKFSLSKERDKNLLGQDWG